MKLTLIVIGKFIALAELQLMELLGNNNEEFEISIFLFAWKVYLARALFRGSWNEAYRFNAIEMISKSVAIISHFIIFATLMQNQNHTYFSLLRNNVGNLQHNIFQVHLLN